MINKFSSVIGLLVAAVGTFFMMAGQAEAHAKLVSANPSPDSEVAAPEDIRLSFSEALEPRFSTFTMKASDGSSVSLAPAADPADAKVLWAEPSTPLSPGIYEISWEVVSGDAHKMAGAFTFTVH
ncbi:MAG: copper homeostasis periplasmic binding protein CopC [Alphaproteobacteria bacterium]